MAQYKNVPSRIMSVMKCSILLHNDMYKFVDLYCFVSLYDQYVTQNWLISFCVDQFVCTYQSNIWSYSLHHSIFDWTSAFQWMTVSWPTISWTISVLWIYDRHQRTISGKPFSVSPWKAAVLLIRHLMSQWDSNLENDINGVLRLALFYKTSSNFIFNSRFLVHFAQPSFCRS